MIIGAARLRLRGVARGLAVKLSLLLAVSLLLGALIPSSAGATSPPQTLGASGHDLTMDGTELTSALFGSDDTTVLQYAILAFIEGQDQYRGDNQNFPGPSGTIPDMDSSAKLFDAYFALCEHYGLNLMRLGAGDQWGASIQHIAWLNHQAAYFNLLEEMANAAQNHSVYIVLVLAGPQPSGDAPYSYGGAGDPRNSSSSAYANYLAYARSTMDTLASNPVFSMFDLFNEPDVGSATFWMNSKSALHAWACKLANDTAAYHGSTLRTLGIGTGAPSMITYGQANFNYAWNTGFEVCQMHIYGGSLEDSSIISNFVHYKQWADALGKPLYIGELADNTVYPLTRWQWAEGQLETAGIMAISSMVVTGSSDYPYTGNIGDLLAVILEPIINAFIVATGSVYGLAGLGVGAVLMLAGIITRIWWLVLPGLAALILTLVWLGGLLGL